MNYEWLDKLQQVLDGGQIANPRGNHTLELLHETITINTQQPVLTVPERKLSYQFMAAEAYWILSGDGSVQGIAPYNKHIAQFSDDGERFFGAYGPKVVAQLPYVIEKLCEDPMSRQAGLTLWRECPPVTKDVPCTIAIFFNLRNGKLNCSVFMRSSDAWLGLPYDLFNFSMLTHLVCAKWNSRNKPMFATPGTLSLTAASMHLYEPHFGAARECLENWIGEGPNATPLDFYYEDNGELMKVLSQLRGTKKGDPLRWWEHGKN